MSDDRHIVLDVWIAIEELVALAKDENAANQKDDHCESERHPQRRETGLLNRRYQQTNIRFHEKNLATLSIGCRNASVGFSTTPEVGI